MGQELSTPIVSVILPTYNRAHLVRQAILSVLNQTYRDLELIVVDDASTDNTKEIIECFDDERLRYIRHENNRGAAAARNTGIRASKGNYIAFQDSDDEWLLEKLERQVEVFTNVPPEVGVVYSSFWRLKGSRKSIFPPGPSKATKLVNTFSVKKRRLEGNIHDDLLEGNLVTLQAAVVRKKCFEKVGMFDERLPCLLDWELWIRISKHYQFKYVDEPLVIAHFTPGGISASQSALASAFEFILEKHYDEEFKGKNELLARHLYSIGNLLCLSGELERGQDYLFRAAKLCPLNKYWIAAFISLFGEDIYVKVVELKCRIRPDWY